jgi:tRNA-2-methylthio-N6-dimethylallyladenosine synthase
MPDLGLYTDVIVGFPGETREMFEGTRRVMEEIEFDVVHLAMYSPRPDTFAAEKLADDVPAEEKRSRINELLQLQRGIAARRTARWVGRPVEVLVEGADELGRPYGRNRQGKRVVVMRSRVEPGALVEVVVKEANAGQLTGVVA